MKQATPFNASDERFLSRLRYSNRSVERVARWLQARGNAVMLRPVFERPDAGRWAEYQDDGDLEVVQRIEVKQRPHMHFTGADDYGFPDVMVEGCDKFNAKRPCPYAYFIVNAEATVAAVIKVHTFPLWVVRNKTDGITLQVHDYYCCPMDHVRFERISADG